MADFLLEIGLEEVPARMIASAEAELLRRTLALLGKEALLPEGFDPLQDAKSYSTPRRLAVLVRRVREQQADLSEEVVGPATKIAFKDGQPGPAAEAFARKNGVAVSELRTITTPKGEYIAATSVKKGRSAAEVLAGEMPKEVGAIYWAKNMRWIPRETLKFVRPVLWIVCLLGDEVVPLTFAGKTAGRASFGHRVLSTGEAFEVVSPESYVAQLEGEYVIADVEARRHKIRKALDGVTRAVAGARWREDEPLVDGVTHLTEWPDVLLGNFEADYLALPEEVLVTVMRDHQKYFAVEDAAGKLAPHFLTVANIALDEANAAIIKQGNERVLKARFNDARFFWEFDQRTPLVERVKLLGNVTFQKDLGSYAKKSEEVGVIAGLLATLSNSRDAKVNEVAVGDAVRLAKTDLTTELVKEFTELQGIIGGLYAKSQGIDSVVADAIYDQYLPASSDDSIPRSKEGCVLGLADRVHTIVGMFSLGMEPTGSKDPFALRRAANSIVKILADGELPLRLSDVLSASSVQPEVRERLVAFFAERIDFYLREARGQAYDVVKAVMAAGADDLRDVVARAEAVSAARGSEDFVAVSAAFKRMKNILAQANYQTPTESGGFVYLSQDEESALAAKAVELIQTVGELSKERKYTEALAAIATIRPEVDAFFEKLMVMDPDIVVRQRRLQLLSTIVSNFSSLADFSEIVVGA
ncbi:MAG: glycine--tRNA ligase subunit beta [Acidobacteriota bacterium]